MAPLLLDGAGTARQLGASGGGFLASARKSIRSSLRGERDFNAPLEPHSFVLSWRHKKEPPGGSCAKGLQKGRTFKPSASFDRQLRYGPLPRQNLRLYHPVGVVQLLDQVLQRQIQVHGLCGNGHHRGAVGGNDGIDGDDIGMGLGKHQ